MSEVRPYPEAEHYEFPASPSEQIAEELRLYPDSPSFRNFITGLGAMYGKAPLMKSFQKYAILMNVARVQSGGVPDETGMDKDFCVGTLVSTHMMMAPSPVSLRRRVLLYEPLDGVEGDDHDLEMRKEIVERLKEWDNEIYLELYEHQDPEFKAQLYALTERVYGDRPNRGWDEQAFLSGFMFGMNMVYGFAKRSGYNPV